MSKEVCDHYLQMLMGQARTMLIGASEAELKVRFFEVLQEFFDNSNCWQEAINFQVIPNLLDYRMEPVSGRIMRLSNVLDQNNVAQAAVMMVPPTVHFMYPYSNTQPMTAIVVKNVTNPLEEFPPDFPEFFLQQYNYALLDGIVGKMMLQPGQSYSNQQSGLYHTQRYRDQVNHARAATMRANTIGSQNWAYPQTYRTYSQRGGVSTFNINPAPTPLR